MKHGRLLSRAIRVKLDDTVGRHVAYDVYQNIPTVARNVYDLGGQRIGGCIQFQHSPSAEHMAITQDPTMPWPMAAMVLAITLVAIVLLLV